MATAVLGESLSTDLLRFSPLVIAIAAFASTNVDDLFLLASLFVDSDFRTGSVVAGQFFGMSFLVIISILAAFFTLSIPGGWICALGVAPLLLGLQRLWRLFKNQRETTLTAENRPDFVGKERLRFRWAKSEMAYVTLLTMANGGDNLSVYISLFSIQRAIIPLYALVFALMTALWCLLGYYLTSHRVFGDKVKRYGRFIVPFILIGIGLNVLSHGFDSRPMDTRSAQLPAVTTDPKKLQ
jgi:cadmium resistance protein CadD (predicted permease)